MRVSTVWLFATSSATLALAEKAAACSPLELVYARATTEAQGLGLVGGPFFSALQKAIPGTTAYSVVYPASWGDASPLKGIDDVVRYFNTKPTQCPQQKYILSGYSQGAVVMHRAAVKLSKDILLNRIIATATFGDGGQQATPDKPVYASPVGPIPMWPVELDGKIKFNCNGKDLTCKPGGTSTVDHMGYNGGGYIPASAEFVKQAFAKSQSAGAAAAPPSL